MTEDTMTENTPISFADLNLSAPIMRAINDSGYTTPSPIQAETIPHVLAGTDVLGQAQTGTGKTAAFALPTLHKINPKNKNVQVLVLAPTRELANQVADSFKSYSKYLDGVQVLPIYGGADYSGQLRGLRNGAQIVVGTPGRVMDHIKKGTLKLDNLNTLVLDEADEMLRMGFIDDVEWILSKSPEEKQITLFSATMPRQIQTITKKYLKNEVVVKIKSKTETAPSIEQFHVGVEPRQKAAALRLVLEMEETDATIIFGNTKAITEELTAMLNRSGYLAASLNGDLQQKQRERVIQDVKSRKLDIIVATDVAARGLDIERITHVINYDLPRDSESYVHRIGRTGRAGRFGRSIAIVSPRDRRQFGFVEQDTKSTIPPYPMPDLASMNKTRVERFKKRISDEVENKKLGYLEEVLRDMLTESDIDPTTMAAALASMALGDTPLLLSSREAVSSFDLHTHRSSNKPERSRDGRRDRGERGEKNGRDRDRPARAERGGKRERMPASEMQRYRLEVGANDNVRPGQVVGAIANEGNIEGSSIGSIDIHNDFTEVMLPKNMAESVLKVLEKTRVMGKPMNLKRVDGEGAGPAKRPARSNDSEGDSPKRRDDRGNRPAKRSSKTFSGRDDKSRSRND